MKFHLRVDNTIRAHVSFTVFANEAHCGTLWMTHDEYSAFGRALLVGAGGLVPATGVTVDVVTMPARKESSIKHSP